MTVPADLLAQLEDPRADGLTLDERVRLAAALIRHAEQKLAERDHRIAHLESQVASLTRIVARTDQHCAALRAHNAELAEMLDAVRYLTGRLHRLFEEGCP